MWRTEDFPRGKTPIKKNVQGLIESKSKEPKFEKSPKESVGEIKKPQKRKSLHISSQPTKKRRISGNQKVFKTPLQDDICTGLHVLGCVRQVFDHSISVSLPGNVVGTLPITELSEYYTHLNKLVDCEEKYQSEDIRSPDELFKPGMLIPVHIEGIDEKQDQKAKKIILSNNPCKLNSTISVKSLADGMLLFGSVSSVEDHGYSVDLGIKTLKAFLPSKNAEAFIKTCNCGFSWKGDVIPHQKYPHRQESDDETETTKRESLEMKNRKHAEELKIQEEAEELFTFLCHDLKHEKLVWKSYGHFLFKSGQVDIARSVLHRALLVLDKRDHVEVIIKFATLEFLHGDIERGCLIFENLIASYSGRTDLWSVYVDMMIKSGDIAGARHLLERAVKQKFNAKKLSFLLQNFKKFEETHGTEEQVEKVRELASSVLN